MRIRTTAAAVGAVLALALTACSSDEPEGSPSSSAPASPSAGTAAAEQACKDAWRQAVESGAIDDGSVSVENPPAECDGVKNGAAVAAEAIREHIEEGRKRLTEAP